NQGGREPGTRRLLVQERAPDNVLRQTAGGSPARDRAAFQQRHRISTTMDDTHQLALPRHPPRDEAPRAPERGATLLAVAGLCSCALALPILAVDFPPITDLPQHLAQVELFLRAIAGDDRYVIQWFTPYSLGYAPLLLLRI